MLTASGLNSAMAAFDFRYRLNPRKIRIPRTVKLMIPRGMNTPLRTLEAVLSGARVTIRVTEGGVDLTEKLELLTKPSSKEWVIIKRRGVNYSN